MFAWYLVLENLPSAAIRILKYKSKFLVSIKLLSMSSLFMLTISVPYLNEIYFDFEASFKRVFFISLLSTIKPNGPSLRFS